MLEPIIHQQKALVTIVLPHFLISRYFPWFMYSAIASNPMRMIAEMDFKIHIIITKIQCESGILVGYFM